PLSLQYRQCLVEGELCDMKVIGPVHLNVFRDHVTAILLGDNFYRHTGVKVVRYRIVHLRLPLNSSSTPILFSSPTTILRVIFHLQLYPPSMNYIAYEQYANWLFLVLDRETLTSVGNDLQLHRLAKFFPDIIHRRN